MMDRAMAAKTLNANLPSNPVGMVVDDDDLIRETVAEVMEDMCEHVFQAADGIEGLELLQRHPDISLVVTDIAMPRLDGVGFAKRARRLHPALKVLFVSGRQRPPDTEVFLAKPFPPRALIAALYHLLEA